MGTSFYLFTARQLFPEVLLFHGSLSWLGSAGQLSFVGGGGRSLERLRSDDSWGCSHSNDS